MNEIAINKNATEYQLDLFGNSDDEQRYSQKCEANLSTKRDRIIFVRLKNECDLRKLSARIGISLEPDCCRLHWETKAVTVSANKNTSNVNQITNHLDWVGMPEFVQNRQRPFAMIKVIVTGVCNNEIAEAFAQPITDKTKSIWFPYKPHRRKERFVYIHET